MRLLELSLGGFQSYQTPATLILHPDLTLLTGLNDAGKSALFRGILAQRGGGAPTEPAEYLRVGWQCDVEQLAERATAFRSVVPTPGATLVDRVVNELSEWS